MKLVLAMRYILSDHYDVAQLGSFFRIEANDDCSRWRHMMPILADKVLQWLYQMRMTLLYRPVKPTPQVHCHKAIKMCIE